VRVEAGDLIFGAVWNQCAPGTLSCATWDVYTGDLTTKQSTLLNRTSSDGQTFNWAFAGVLEVYDISRCADYPSNGSTSFNNLYLTDDKVATIDNPAWSISNDASGLTPQCNYGGSVVSPTDVKLRY
jgi:hypothetical protein